MCISLSRVESRVEYSGKNFQGDNLFV
jgi:hypothetical protein